MVIPDFDKLLWSNDSEPLSTLAIKDWLLDKQSLTAKLKAMYADFSVQVLNKQSAKPNLSEVKFFSQLPSNANYQRREVLLLARAKPLVYANSLIPNTAKTATLLTLQNKPLGEVLFDQGKLKRNRTEFSISKIGVWGRRCAFDFNGVCVLVCEFFLDKNSPQV